MYKTSFALLLLLSVVVVLASCGSNSSAPPETSTLSISPSSTSVIAGETKQFTATVTGSSNTAVTWSIAGSGCGNSCGSINQSGLYSAPSLIPQSATVTVTATLQSNNSVKATATITHLPVTVSMSPSIQQTVMCDTTLQFSATVQNHTEVGVTWHVNQVEGGTDEYGHVSSTGLYTAPHLVPNPETVSVSVKSKADPTKSATVLVSISANPGGGMTGRYLVFWHEGPFSLRQFVGSFVADGQGHITDGKAEYREDMDVTTVSFTGTYFYKWTIMGGQGRLEITPSAGPPLSLEFKPALDKFGRIYSGGRMLGFIEKQDESAFTSGTVAGDWVFRMTGFAFASGGITTLADAVGRFTNTSGTVSLGWYDLTENKQLTNQNISFQGTIVVDATGRGTLAMTSYGRITGNLVFYVISPNKLAIVQTSSTAPAIGMSGIAERQANPNVDDTTLNGDYAFFLNGSIGRMTLDGASHISAGNMDVVDDLNGTVSLNNMTFTGIYHVNTYGRTGITLQVPGEPDIAAVAYVVSPTKFYLMGFPSGPGGEAIAQTGKPFSISSWQQVGIIALVGNTTTNYVGMFGDAGPTTSAGEGNFEVDFSDSGIITRSISSYVNYTIATDGRVQFVLDLPAPIGAMNLRGYMVDSGRMLLLGTRSGLPLQGEIVPYGLE